MAPTAGKVPSPPLDLQDRARYGQLTFDSFALNCWDKSASLDEGQNQWNRLVSQYNALRPVDRVSYYKQSFHVENGTRPPPSPEEAIRILQPHQTPSERQISTRFRDVHDPLCLRTCYMPDLQAVFMEIKDSTGVGEDAGISDYLDDEALYNFGSDWSKILFRLPELCDTQQLLEEESLVCLPKEIEGGEEERASVAVVTRLFLVDEEALRERLLKVLWLDAHGLCVWWNKLELVDLENFHGRCLRGWSLSEFISGGAGKWLPKGCVLPI